MENKRLYTPAAIQDSIQRYGLRMTKSLGQNFLKDGNIVRKICEAAGVTEDDVVLEIGPGIGTLTEELSLRAKKVVAVEIDKRLIPVLAENLSWRDNVTVIEGDILQVDIAQILCEHAPTERVLVVANLPYYITTPILTALLESETKIASITAMMQKEVAQRLTALPKTSAYGSLSVYAQAYSDPETCFIVPPTVFIPMPSVASAVVHLVRKEVDSGMDATFFAFVRQAFGQRRKTMVNALSHQSEYAKDEIRAAITASGFSESVRAEALSAKELFAVYRRLCD